MQLGKGLFDAQKKIGTISLTIDKVTADFLQGI